MDEKRTLWVMFERTGFVDAYLRYRECGNDGDGRRSGAERPPD